MIRRDRRMRGLPTGSMTRLTVTAGCKGLACCGADQSTGTKRMTVGAVCLMCRRINQSISMTACTVIRTGSRYQAAVIRGCCMDRVPGRTMTRCTVTADAEVLTYGQTL